MSELTPAERAAAREFRDSSAAAFSALPEPDQWHPVLVHHVRHVCPVLGKSVSFEMREVYQESPPYVVHENGDVVKVPLDGWPEGTTGLVLVPAGRFAFIFREGRCPDCKVTARSRTWRLVDARKRAPLGRS